VVITKEFLVLAYLKAYSTLFSTIQTPIIHEFSKD